MESKNFWSKALGISAEQLQTWLSQGVPEARLLEWCLDEGHIKESEYLKWAREFYGLPSVRAEFFESPVPKDLWKKYSKHSWKASVFPLVEWDGVVFVGVIDPTEVHFSDLSMQMVLVPYSLQKVWWQAVQEIQQTSSFPEAAPVEPSAASPEAAIEFDFEDLDKSLSDIDPKGTYVTGSSPIHDVSDLKESDAPMGLSLDLNIPSVAATPAAGEFKLNLALSDGKAESTAVVPPPQKEEELEKTEITAVPKFSLSLERNASQDSVVASPAVAAPPTPVASAKPVTPAPALAPTAKPAMPPPPPGVKPVTLSSVPTPPPPPGMKSKPTVTAPPMAPASTPVASTSGKSPVSVLPVIEKTFLRMQEHFVQCMVLTYQDEVLKPWQWSPLWQAPSEIKEINSKESSIFRIVIDSKQPYHGYISPNEINSDFFRTWNQGKTPDHVTIIPLIKAGEIFGMLLGTAQRDKSPSISLPAYQMVGDELANAIKDVFTKAA